jgi:hypothetical protein
VNAAITLLFVRCYIKAIIIIIASVTPLGDKIVAYRVLVGKSQRKRHLGRYIRRWEDNIKMTLEEIGWEKHRLY